MKTQNEHLINADRVTENDELKRIAESNILPDGETGRATVLFFRVFSNLQKAMESMFLPHGVSAAQIRVLYYISKFDKGCRLSQLVIESHYSSKQNLSSLASRLIKIGLLVQEPDPDDMRAKRYKLSADGKQLLDQLLPKHKEVLAEAFNCLSDQEITSLLTMLRKLSRKIDSLQGIGE